MSEPDNATLSLSGLTVERGRRTVVREVSIEIPAGEVTALLGPNGAGKSSLVLAVGGVLRLRAGSVLAGGREFAGRRPERIRHAGIAIVPEGRRLLPDLSVEDNSGRWSCSPRSRGVCRLRPGRCPAASSRWSCWPRPLSPSRATC
jgi:ABC-type branched-subunit amino acid transport system ATPase component